jgi:hypothetical protein
MSIALREENFVVINIGSNYTTAGIGMHDTNKPPTVVIITLFCYLFIFFINSQLTRINIDCQYG